MKSVDKLSSKNFFPVQVVTDHSNRGLVGKFLFTIVLLGSLKSWRIGKYKYDSKSKSCMGEFHVPRNDTTYEGAAAHVYSSVESSESELPLFHNQNVRQVVEQADSPTFILLGGVGHRVLRPAGYGQMSRHRRGARRCCATVQCIRPTDRPSDRLTRSMHHPVF